MLRYWFCELRNQTLTTTTTTIRMAATRSSRSSNSANHTSSPASSTSIISSRSVSLSRSPFPVATFSSGYSNHPGSSSYVEVASDVASSLRKQPLSVSISEKFTALSLRRVSTSEDHADNTSQQPLDEDVVMTESSKEGQMPGSGDRVTKPVSQSSPNSKGYTSKLVSWKAMFNKMSDLVDQLMLEMMEEDDPVKIERLDKKIALLSKNLHLLEDRIASAKKPTSGTGNSGVTTPQLASAKVVKPVIPIGGIPPLRLLHDASFNVKYFDANKVRPEEVDNSKTFKTIHDFLRRNRKKSYGSCLKNYSLPATPQNIYKFTISLFRINSFSFELNLKAVTTIEH
ncbi:hypothetical protein CU097_009871 [Rhizopus azygosporus]|uniref:Uncharacterized protein n=1 Tax=Rhizopus azygosporus TaxID=86630 RepID=A0A367JHG7_RHIAZ|nr:hypothetical protein CU097_009871 [Rhizopus azygosporus]